MLVIGPQGKRKVLRNMNLALVEFKLFKEMVCRLFQVAVEDVVLVQDGKILMQEEEEKNDNGDRKIPTLVEIGAHMDSPIELVLVGKNPFNSGGHGPKLILMRRGKHGELLLQGQNDTIRFWSKFIDTLQPGRCEYDVLLNTMRLFEPPAAFAHQAAKFARKEGFHVLRFDEKESNTSTERKQVKWRLIAFVCFLCIFFVKVWGIEEISLDLRRRRLTTGGVGDEF